MGREYVHAETRKAPTVDGIVERDVFGKEVRHKCRLTKYEKKIAQKIVDAIELRLCPLSNMFGADCSVTPLLVDQSINNPFSMLIHTLSIAL